VQKVLLTLFAIVLVAVHGIAPGSGKVCTMKAAMSCNRQLNSQTQMTAPDCCADECMTGSNINLPSTELSPQHEISAKKFQTEKVLNPSADLVEIRTFNFSQYQYANNPGSGPPLQQMTRLAKLHILII
jgi:hypothetical protein